MILIFSALLLFWVQFKNYTVHVRVFQFKHDQICTDSGWRVHFDVSDMHRYLCAFTKCNNSLTKTNLYGLNVAIKHWYYFCSNHACMQTPPLSGWISQVLNRCSFCRVSTEFMYSTIYFKTLWNLLGLSIIFKKHPLINTNSHSTSPSLTVYDKPYSAWL
jgi:hypothetical protein